MGRPGGILGSEIILCKGTVGVGENLNLLKAVEYSCLKPDANQGLRVMMLSVQVISWNKPLCPVARVMLVVPVGWQGIWEISTFHSPLL
jgi:hypothetical protein